MAKMRSSTRSEKKENMAAPAAADIGGDQGLRAAAAAKVLHRARGEAQARLVALRGRRDENLTVLQSLTEAAEAETDHHPAMIPVGKGAFMWGSMARRAPVLVLLGANYWAERTPGQAVQIVNRRIAGRPISPPFCT